MKKLLGVLASATMIGTAGATVVACGNTTAKAPETPETPSKGDDFSEINNLFTADQILATRKNIWLNLAEFTRFNQGSLDDAKTSELIWTGMLDARHGKDESGTNESLKDFKDRDIANRLHFTGNSLATITNTQLVAKFQAEVDHIANATKDEANYPVMVNLRAAIATFNFQIKETGKVLELFNDVMTNVKAYNALETTTEKLATTFSIDVAAKKTAELGIKVDNNLFVYFTLGGEITKSGLVESAGTFKELAINIIF